jgi:ribonuclease R
MRFSPRKQGHGWRLVVAIADVSHYVQPGTALDREARERGNSVYFPRRVIPMLPEKLSNGLCSLNPDVDRLAMVCDMTVDDHGEITDYRFLSSGFPLARAADL